MSFTFGNTTISDAYFGAIKIGSAYLGSTLVYQSAHKYNYYWLEFALLATLGAGAGTSTTIYNLKVNNAAPNTTQTYLWDDSTLSYANKPQLYTVGEPHLINVDVPQADIEETYTSNGHAFSYYIPGIIRLGFTTSAIPSNISFDINSSYSSLCDVVTTLYGSDYPYFSNAIQLEQKCHVAVKDTTASINWNVTDSGVLTNAPYTLRFHFMNSTYDPTTISGWKAGSTWTKVSSSPNIWDYTHESSNWDDEFNGKFNSSSMSCAVIAAGDMSGITSMKNVAYASNKVAGGVFGSGGSSKNSYFTYVCKFDTSNVTNMDGMFFRCLNLRAVPNFDTSSCTSFWSTFDRCTYISKYPKFDHSKATSIRAMHANNHSLCYLPDCSDVTSNLNECQYAFQNTYSVMKGITSAYNYLSAVNPANHAGTFLNCGLKTTQGSAELANIPSDWKS